MFWERIRKILRNWYILIFLALTYIPMIFIVILSFTNASDRGNITGSLDNFSGGNWIDFFKGEYVFVNALLNSVFVLLLVVPISLLISIFACIGMWYCKQKNRNLILSLSKTNIAIPDIITGIMLSILFSFTWIGLGFDLGYFTVVLAHISFCTPYAIVTIYPSIMKMNKNLVDASMDLGYSRLGTYFKFIIPYLKKPIIVAALIITSISLDDFIITTLVGGNFDTIGTTIFESRKGIKAWIVTFGAIVVVFMILITIFIAIHNIRKQRRLKNANIKKN